jgi:hypothetical protein
VFFALHGWRVRRRFHEILIEDGMGWDGIGMWEVGGGISVHSERFLRETGF